jgi:hypothetical protein
MKSSWWISLLLLTVSCAGGRTRQSALPPTPHDTTIVSRFRTLIKTQKAEITGILVLKYAEGEWRGSLTNEFGVKAFDFIVAGNGCRLLNVNQFLDRRQIRRTVAEDLLFFLLREAKDDKARVRSLDPLPDGGFILRNHRRNIEYLFKAMKP